MEIKRAKLENGLRILVIEMPNYHTVSTGVFVKSGSRYENRKQSGLSHFLEHLVMMGTEKYPSAQAISAEIEEVGGICNAQTSQEYNYYFNVIPKDHYQKGMDIVAEVVLKAKLREKDIEKEKPVILEEIKMYQDEPNSHVSEMLIELMDEDYSLGWPILGKKKTVNSFDRSDLTDYYKQFYSLNNMILVVAGPVEKQAVVDQAEKLFSGSTGTEIPTKQGFQVKQTKPRVDLEYRKTKQAHLALGTYGFSYDDPKLFPWLVMNTILGERGGSSRLFVEFREKRSLGYDIVSFVDGLKEIGIQMIYAGCNYQKPELALQIMIDQLDKMKKEPVLNSELERVKGLLTGRVAMKLDDPDSIARYWGEQELLYKKNIDFDEYKKKVENVSKEDILKVAQEAYQTKYLNLAIIGPYKDSKKFEKILKLTN